MAVMGTKFITIYAPLAIGYLKVKMHEKFQLNLDKDLHHILKSTRKDFWTIDDFWAK